MKPTTFIEHNTVDLWNGRPLHSLEEKVQVEGQTHQWSISCWKLSLWERIRILFTGTVWAMRTDRNAILTLDKEDLIRKP